jgi:hypothetical protein
LEQACCGSLGDPRRAVLVCCILIPLVLLFGCKGQEQDVEKELEPKDFLCAELGDAAVQHVTDLIVDDMVDFAAPLVWTVETVDMQLAELDGVVPLEGVVQVEECTNEEYRKYYVVAYSLQDPENPRLIDCVNTHDERLMNGYLKIADLDGDGKDEVIVIGDTDGEGSPSEFHVFALNHTSLEDIAQGPACAAAYFLVDSDLNGGMRIIGIRVDRSGPRAIYSAASLDKVEGYVCQTGSFDPGREMLRRIFEKAVGDETVGRPCDLRLLADCMRAYGAAPGSLDILQPKLEDLYFKYGDASIVDAMAWPGNTAALPFLNGILGSSDNESGKAEFTRALTVIQGGIVEEPLPESLLRR